MNGRILLILLLGISFLFFGCAKQAEAPQEEQEIPEAEETPPAEEVEEETPVDNDTGLSEEDLADLFQIETDEPLGGEGLDTSTPSANSS
jgi:hypothetical protein